MNCRMTLMMSFLLLSMFPALSIGQTSEGKGGGSGLPGGGFGGFGSSGGPPGGQNSGGAPPGGAIGRGMPGGMSGGGMMPGGIRLTYPGGAGSSGSEGGGYGGMDGGMGGGESESPDASGQTPSIYLGGKSYQVSRTFNFHYVLHSFRPEQNFGQANYGGGYGSGGAMGMMGAPGGSAGAMGGGMAGRDMGGFGKGGGVAFPGTVPADSGGLAINIFAFVIDGEMVNERTRIELAVQGFGTNEDIQHMTFTLLEHQSSNSYSLKLPESEIKLVSKIIRQTIWMEDALKLIRENKGQGESAAANEKLLKQLLAEQYDTQITRREMEAESIKKRLDALQEELERRKLAKDRVVEVQWGRLILDAQGLLNKE